MHPNPVFRNSSDEQALQIASDRGFGIVSVNGANGPIAAHIPFIIDPSAMFIDGHVMRSNPLTRALKTPQQALLAVSGPDAYISPDWYNVENQVPTWNYIAVHIRGEIRLMPQETLRDVLDNLSHEFERRLAPKPIWQSEKMPKDALDRMLRMIVPVRLDISSVECTQKLGQNKSDDARSNAVKGLSSSNIGMEIASLAKSMSDEPE